MASKNGPICALRLVECAAERIDAHHPSGPSSTQPNKHQNLGRNAMATSVPLHVNGESVTVKTDDPDMPLLYALRDNLKLRGPRFGCGLGQCGSCTVHVDGEAVRSCITPLSSLKAAQKIVTLEGLGSPEKPHPVQKAFIDEQAVQCGYCINGMIMQSAAFLAQNPHPTAQQIKAELANNLCRCGTHLRIVRAILRAATEMRKAGP
jgi:nicotinate dehydrogenase subunit A